MAQIPTVALGRGVVMPMVGFGTWQLGSRRGYEAIRYALEVGYRHIDSATMYRNEQEVGQVIRASGLDRGEVVVLRWHLDHGITVIPKSSKPDRIRSNLDLFAFSLTPDEVARLDRL